MRGNFHASSLSQSLQTDEIKCGRRCHSFDHTDGCRCAWLRTGGCGRCFRREILRSLNLFGGDRLEDVNEKECVRARLNHAFAISISHRETNGLGMISMYSCTRVEYLSESIATRLQRRRRRCGCGHLHAFLLVE